jgi:hypothetical protein
MMLMKIKVVIENEGEEERRSPWGSGWWKSCCGDEDP